MLRKFLDVFSAFDWDNKALSLQGPIPLSAFEDADGVLQPQKTSSAVLLSCFCAAVSPCPEKCSLSVFRGMTLLHACREAEA